LNNSQYELANRIAERYPPRMLGVRVFDLRNAAARRGWHQRPRGGVKVECGGRQAHDIVEVHRADRPALQGVAGAYRDVADGKMALAVVGAAPVTVHLPDVETEVLPLAYRQHDRADEAAGVRNL